MFANSSYILMVSSQGLVSSCHYVTLFTTLRLIQLHFQWQQVGHVDAIPAYSISLKHLSHSSKIGLSQGFCHQNQRSVWCAL